MEKYNVKKYIDVLKKQSQIQSLKNISESFLDAKVEHLAYNSNEIIKDSMFVCKGSSFKVEYLQDAIQKGAIIYISEKEYNVNIPAIIVKDIKIALSELSNIYFNEPQNKLNIIGITGTKGKSTTTYYIKYILEEYYNKIATQKPAIISSIDTYDGVENYESHITTPESYDLQKIFSNAVSTNIKDAVMEVSSQALKYGRVHSLNFNYGVFLNISEDHISPIEHPDFEDYFNSKLKFFERVNTAIVNLDSEFKDMVYEVALRDSKRVITFSTKNKEATFFGYNIRKDGINTVFSVKTKEYDKEFVLTMPGLFNIENAIAAIAVTSLMNIPLDCIYEGLKKARSSGRMEVYSSKDNRVTIIVDYAHNKLSFEKLYESTKAEYPNCKITTIFGCPGKKAYLRRRDLGLLAGKNSDKVYLTAEDPGEEPVEQISRDIAQYVAQNNENYELIEDRGEAIKDAVKTAIAQKERTVILLTGKGNETRQKIGKEYIPCRTDVEYSKEFLNAYDNGEKL